MTPPVDTRVNTVRPLCSLALSVLCWVFVCASFLRNPKKYPGHLSLTEGRMWRISWVRNKYFLELIVDCFVFARECIISKKQIITSCLFNKILFYSYFALSLLYLFQKDFPLWTLLWQYMHWCLWLFICQHFSMVCP